ncbi:polysaccharide biosynthesis tyrosine autokinase [Mucilaginibacter sp. RB4R14]|uniref:GumC family protein n=1 Tax=Mucilaginibacter aurantiaciroseus TaxID=2949308 RepID=UPI002091269C|nr:polysaccharide biosynthesis tyrosine autokinase [Mucilaginibacter aurantiaciroseus]MCO5934661.1 polysaccharide biosynthesis tyrosine autokinase [Mucilaginibacter aurantiaciroseus]
MKLIRKPIEENSNSLSLVHYVFKLIHYWPLFLTLLLIGVGGAWLYMQFTIPMYQTTSRLLIKDDKKGTQDTKAFEALDIISPKKSIDNEIEVIQSKDLIGNVVGNLNLYAPVYSESKFKNVLAYHSSPIIVSTNNMDSLIQVEKVYFKLQDSTVLINNNRYPLNKLVSTPYGNLIFKRNPHLIKTSSNDEIFYFSLLTPKKVISSVSARLKVSSANKLTTIIDIAFTDENPDRSEAVVLDIIRSYNRSIAEEKNVLAANTEKFIDERLTISQNNLLAIEHKQQNYQADRGAIDISTQGKLFLENVSNNDQKVGEINMHLSVLDQIENSVKSKNLSSEIVPSTIGVDDPGLTQMVKNIYELQLEVESLKKTTGINNPLIVSYVDKIEKIKPQILQNLDNQRQSLLASKGNLSTTNKTYSSKLESMPETEKTLIDINRELTIQSGIYTFLLQKKEETGLSFISNVDGSKVIQKPASSEFPVTPQKKIIYLAAMLIAFILGGIMIAVKESLRNNIMYQSDIEVLTDIPVIAEISSGNSKDPIVIGSNQRTLIAEQFRKLRITLAYLGIGGVNKRVLVTSGIAGEGKSFVALNLAISLAITGKKVVILDLDLTNPSLHVKFKVKKSIGITDFLEGKVSADAIINSTEVSDGLFFISAGNLSNDPSELLTNGRAEEFLKYLDGIFDFIIIDVAPVGPISDAYIISPLCDATLYIVRHGYTPKAFVGRIDKNNVLNKLNNAAIVFNDVSSRSFGNYGYGYGYNYGYGYGDTKKRLSGSAS